jgi:DNA-binding transcriptional MerR regulator
MSKIPDTLTKRYYTMGEVAKMFGVKKSLVRYWEQEFDYLKPWKSGKGERRFTADNLRQFETIFQLVKEKGYTVSGAKKFLQEEKEHLRQKQETMKALKRLRGFLEDLKLEIK